MAEPDVTGDRADIVVALTSYNDAQTVGPVIRAVKDGLARAFAGSSARIAIADAGFDRRDDVCGAGSGGPGRPG